MAGKSRKEKFIDDIVNILISEKSAEDIPGKVYKLEVGVSNAIYNKKVVVSVNYKLYDGKTEEEAEQEVTPTKEFTEKIRKSINQFDENKDMDSITYSKPMMHAINNKLKEKQYKVELVNMGKDYFVFKVVEYQAETEEKK